ncbi:hypothetical protein HJC23_001009 [Cyclotella cryptica]|uniref:tRNA/rRNA methyltransferase SpoU type domain-containing protein n=1 Tax=Cyclotella cryptica TaxID=29204 RepID=A0ABD3NZD8_9STRA|eukprot:CCRYP_018875-RA/>CCRYP_018875-RA protein AED:0.18 eAED:0.18 QI:0/-1/0/1/-1/1/1/0/355
MSEIPNWERITNHQTSKTVKLFKSVHRANKSKRSELGLTVAEGVRLVNDILSNEVSRRLVRNIVVAESLFSDVSGAETEENRKKLQYWLRIAHEESIQRKIESHFNESNETNTSFCTVNIGTEQVLKACSGTVTTQGVVALMKTPKPYNLISCSTDTAPFYLILDGLSDPGNVGTLLRSCAASNATALIVLPDSCDVWNPKVLRSAMGASFRVPVLEMSEPRKVASNQAQVGAFKQLLHLLQQCGVNTDRVFAATMEAAGDKGMSKPLKQSIPHYNVDWVSGIGSEKGGAALVLGREGEGLRSDVRDAIQEGIISTIHVPMAPGTESLNAAVCGSVIMFERMRQLILSEENMGHN